MDVFQITTSVFCLMIALVKLVLFQIQTKIKIKNQKTNEQLKERQKQRQGKV